MDLLQHTQVDPLLIFLLQRDVNLQREAMLRNKNAARISGRHVLGYMAAILGIGIATLLIAFYTKLAFDALGVAGLLWFIALYALFTAAMAAWFERRRGRTNRRRACVSRGATTSNGVIAYCWRPALSGPMPLSVST